MSEDDEIRQEKLEELGELVSNESGLFINDDEKILLRFLYFSNFDVERAFEKMKSWYKLKLNNPDWFASQVFTERQQLAMSRDVHCLLKDKDHLGRRIYILKLGNVVVGECEPWENFQVDDLWLELAMDEEETQKNGLVYIFDMKGLSLKYLRYFTPFNCKVASTKAENIPIRKMEYHVVNSGFLLNSMVTIVFPFLSGSTKQNIHFHKTNWPSLHKFISPDVLPMEYGGKLPPLDYKKLRTYISDRQARLEDIVKYGYRD
ncbi:hypothetical protein GE061_010231 [Apolygus lucorum]|uniref:CRAL-TRIO domain-containing protein n=1 Tax=Apolygus lucorum TaxID=248454 RepID=A0A8S9Y2N1_APOLU|nr:hypothetical protein GE061_010231 [Apolygus lucorum]